MKKIAVIGAGQLGSRHLQALAKLDIESKIFVVDPSDESLFIAKSRFDEIGSANKHLFQLCFLNDISKLDQELDIVVIATNSDVRLRALESIMANRKVSYLILEKVLFQKLSDYETASELLESNGTKAWVNCSRRMWGFYERLHESLKNERVLSFNVYGIDWGLASNAIHMIDLFSYLSGLEDYSIDKVQIQADLFESKRKGFIEFNGNISGNFGKNLPFSISSLGEGKLPLTVEIITENGKHVVSEGLQKYLYSSFENKWEIIEFDFAIPYQSQLTNIAVKNIIETSESKLPSFELSMKLHLPFIKSLLKSMSEKEKKEFIECPIT